MSAYQKMRLEDLLFKGRQLIAKTRQEAAQLVSKDAALADHHFAHAQVLEDILDELAMVIDVPTEQTESNS